MDQPVEPLISALQMDQPLWLKLKDFFPNANLGL
jgi:hypothetical protein